MSDEREQRNKVFAPPPSAQQGIPMASAADRMRQDFGYEIPVEVVPLPSNGVTYPPTSPLHMCETVDIKAMTTKEEDILTSAALLKRGVVITELLRSCLINKTIEPLDMLTGDRSALLVAIRITGYGAAYDAEITCPECDTKRKHAFDLAALPIQRLDLVPIQPGTNLFEFKLPQSGFNVKFRFLTGRDEEEAAAIAAKQRKLNLPSDAAITTNLLQCLVSVNGNEDRAKLATFVRNMPARDSLALREHVRKHEPGIQMKQEAVCESCGHSEEVTMPLGPAFLWPTAG